MNHSNDHTKSDTLKLNLQEGAAKNYYKALHAMFGGEVRNDSYQVANAIVKVRMNSFRVEPGMEILVSESWHDADILMDRSPDGDADFVHINLAIEGSVNQSFQEKEVTMEANTLKGAFVYNGLFPMRIFYPAKQNYRSISIKIQSSTLEALLPEALDMYKELFSDPLGVGYHASIPVELEKLCHEILHYRNAGFGSRSMVIARGIEALTIVFDTIRKMREKKQLNGLHPDDYERLQDIKEWILSHLEEKVSLEKLASEFGISVSKLKRDFKSLFDSSVYQFYTQARMDEAFRRLKSGKYTVMEVGYDLGYQNLSKFSEMFKKIKGISPSEVL